jgi:hypothetical protein
MNREATEKLRLDRRLMHRRGWIARTEFEKALEDLPDVSDKIAPSEESDSGDATRGAGDSAAGPGSPRA